MAIAAIGNLKWPLHEVSLAMTNQMTSGTSNTSVKIVNMKSILISMFDYPDALRAKAVGKSSELIELDCWYRGALQEAFRKRITDSDAHLTRDELARIVQWKMAREKPRPRLLSLVTSNSEESVITTTSKAYSSLSKISLESLKGALGILTALKGIGPATASAILAVFVPKHAVFYSDELWATIPRLGLSGSLLVAYKNRPKQRYDVKEWEIAQSAILEILEADSKTEDDNWDKLGGAEAIEKASWAKICLEKQAAAHSSLKRKSTDDSTSKPKKLKSRKTT